MSIELYVLCQADPLAGHPPAALDKLIGELASRGRATVGAIRVIADPDDIYEELLDEHFAGKPVKRAFLFSASATATWDAADSLMTYLAKQGDGIVAGEDGAVRFDGRVHKPARVTPPAIPNLGTLDAVYVFVRREPPAVCEVLEAAGLEELLARAADGGSWNDSGFGVIHFRSIPSKTTDFDQRARAAGLDPKDFRMVVAMDFARAKPAAPERADALRAAQELAPRAKGIAIGIANGKPMTLAGK